MIKKLINNKQNMMIMIFLSMNTIKKKDLLSNEKI